MRRQAQSSVHSLTNEREVVIQVGSLWELETKTPSLPLASHRPLSSVLSEHSFAKWKAISSSCSSLFPPSTSSKTWKVYVHDVSLNLITNLFLVWDVLNLPGCLVIFGKSQPINPYDIREADWTPSRVENKGEGLERRALRYRSLARRER